MTAQIIDENGYMSIENNPISRVGVFPYLGKTIPGAPDPDKIYYVYRPAEELQDPECQRSFANLPIIDDHVSLHGDLTDDSYGDEIQDPEKKGVHGVTGEAIDFRDNVLYSNIKIFSKALKDRIRKEKKKGLSLGYKADYEYAPGTFDGQKYDYVQRSLRGNHLALVDKPRNDVYVLDHMVFDNFDLSLNKEEMNMADPTVQDPAQTAAPEVTIESLAAQVAQLAEAVKAVAAKVEEKQPDPAPAADTNKPEGEPEPAKTEDEGKTEEKVATMDSAIKTLTQDFADFKKGGIKSLMGEISKRDTLVQKLTPFVGTFDHADMTHDEVAKYGVEKLKIECEKGQEASALNGYLHGRTPAQVAATVHDSATSGKSAVTEYLNGAKQ